MIKLKQKHYVIKLIEEMLPYGISSMRIGALTVNLQYPNNELGYFTLLIRHDATKTGLMFNILHNAFKTTIIESTTDADGGVFYKQTKTFNSKRLSVFNILHNEF